MTTNPRCSNCEEGLNHSKGIIEIKHTFTIYHGDHDTVHIRRAGTLCSPRCAREWVLFHYRDPSEYDYPQKETP